MKRIISVIITFITIGLVPLSFSGCSECKRNNDTSVSFVDYHLVEMGKYARVVKLNHPKYTHRVYFSDDGDKWPIDEHLVGPYSHYDFIHYSITPGSIPPLSFKVVYFQRGFSLVKKKSKSIISFMMTPLSLIVCIMDSSWTFTKDTFI